MIDGMSSNQRPASGSRWPRQIPGLAFGADYNPEQWPADTWREDLRLMQEVGVNLVAVNVFGWASLEPEPDRFELDELSRVMDMLAEHGVYANLGTGTASPPPWFWRRFPDTLPMTAEGTRLWPGGRQAWCPSSPTFRERALGLVYVVAEHFADHPALAMWHVSNELGCHNARCYCDISAEAFRRWLRSRYDEDIDALNAAWGTAFWSQRYTDWRDVLPPRAVPAIVNPAQQLDFRRFSSAELLDHFRAERDLLRKRTPGVPVTTNLMVTEHINALDYAAWGPELDIVANDHYLIAEDPDAHVELAFCADRVRGLARGEPWFLMEHSTSAVNWQPRNVAKRPGELRRNSLAHVARGADAVSFFQWRASTAGAERHHSALIPHAGTDTKIWREVQQLGRDLRAIQQVKGTHVEAPVAMLVDYQSQWALEHDAHPSRDVTGLDRAHALYRAAWHAGVTTTILAPGADLTGYQLVLIPTLYLVSDATAAAVSDYVGSGGHVVVTYYSGIADMDDRIRLGGYPGAFRDLLGVHVEEFFPLRHGERIRLDDGSTADVWTELLHLRGAEAVSSYRDGPLPGVPAVTRRSVGRGAAWYVATRLDAEGTARLLGRVLTEAGIEHGSHPTGVEVVRRVGAGKSFLFVVNHTDSDVEVDADGVDLVTGRTCSRTITVVGGGVGVVQEVVDRSG